MARLALFAALAVLAACGPASQAPDGPNIAYTGTGGPGGGSTATGATGTDGGTFTDGGTTPAVVTYSLDCAGYAIDAQIAYHYETHDDGHVLTNCNGTSAEGTGSQSNDWAADAGGTDAINRDEGWCGFPIAVQGGADGGLVGLNKWAKGDQAEGWYYESGPLNQTQVIWNSCAITTPAP